MDRQIRETPVTRFVVAALLLVAILHPHTLLAQSPPDDSDGSVRAGDRYTFDTKDEITGEPKGTYTSVVTEVTDKEVVTVNTFRGRAGQAMIVFDHNMDTVDDSVWKYSPNNAQGVHLPLSVGKEWRSQYDAKNMQNGVILRSSGTAKVVAQETVTTQAGSFDTFKIEYHILQHNTVDPTRGSETEIVTWYAPKISRWVRRTFAFRVEKRLRSSTSEELVDFSRKL
jgi:hypothetical protein